MDEMTQIVDEFFRLMKINHDFGVSDEDVKESIRKVFNVGYNFGEIRKIVGSEWYDHKKIRNFDLERNIKVIVDEIKPKRIDNNREFEYNGKDIDSYDSSYIILATDFPIKDMLRMLNDPDSGDYSYGLIPRNMDLDRQLEECYDDEEREWVRNAFHKQELERLFVKIHQLGIMNGYNDTDEVDPYISTIYDLKDEVRMSDYVDMLKKEHPEWEDYRDYFKK